MQIDVWSDYACPWCALGLARLSVALSDFEHGDDVTVVHRSFELDRHAPASSPGTAEEAVARKYGMRPEQVRAGHAQLTALGAEVGFTFDFETGRGWATPSTRTGSPRPPAAPSGRTRWCGASSPPTSARGASSPIMPSCADVARSVGLPEDVTEEVLGGTAYGERGARPTRPPPRSST